MNPSRLATSSLWLDAAAPHAPAERSDTAPPESEEWDSVVVGGGLAGLTAALRLAQRGAKVLVLEARTIAGRTTGHSTAKVTALQADVYRKLSSGKGLETATIYARESLRAVERLASTVEELGIECDMQRAPALTCASEDRELIDEEFAAARNCGLPVRLVEPVALQELPMPVVGAVILDDQLRIDPVRLCRGLADELRALGATVCERVRVTAVEEDRHGCIVAGDGWSVRSGSAVLATHLPIVDPGLLAGRTKPMRSYAVAGVPTIPTPAGLYLAADAGWSLRPTGPDGRGLIVGGEGHAMLDTVDSAPRLERLSDWAASTFGMQPTHRWSAFDYVSVDGLPFVGRLAPGSDRRFVATAFGKWGMTTSMIAGDLIADLVDGRTHPAAEALDASRLVANIGRDIVKNNVKVAKRFVGGRAIPARPESAALEPGTGTVVRRGTTFVAVARATSTDWSTRTMRPARTSDASWNSMRASRPGTARATAPGTRSMARCSTGRRRVRFRRSRVSTWPPWWSSGRRNGRADGRRSRGSAALPNGPASGAGRSVVRLAGERRHARRTDQEQAPGVAPLVVDHEAVADERSDTPDARDAYPPPSRHRLGNHALG